MTDISIIITAHADRGYMDECIESIVTNGFKGTYEIIIASDGCPELVKYISEGIKFSLSDKCNLAANFNKAAQMAEGKYLKIIADDDMLYDGCLQVLFDEAEKNNADLCIGNIQHLGLDKKIIEYKMPSGDIRKLIADRKMCGGAHIVNTKSFLSVGGFDEDYSIAESFILYYRLINNGFDKFCRVDYPIAIYRHHDKQKSLHLTPEQQQKRKSEMDEIIKKYHFA